MSDSTSILNVIPVAASMVHANPCSVCDRLPGVQSRPRADLAIEVGRAGLGANAYTFALCNRHARDLGRKLIEAAGEEKRPVDVEFTALHLERSHESAAFQVEGFIDGRPFWWEIPISRGPRSPFLIERPIEGDITAAFLRACLKALRGVERWDELSPEALKKFLLEATLW